MKRLCLLYIFVLFAAGCGSRAFTNTPRTAVEQLLLSTAVDNALDIFQTGKIKGEKTYIDFSNLESVDSEYVTEAVRSRFAELGAVLVDEPNDARYIAEVSSGALGTEYKSVIFGIPAIPVPNSNIAMPELALAKTVEQTGIAKLLILIHDKGSLVDTGLYHGKADRDEKFILWFRSQPKDDVRKGWEKADAELEQKSSED